MDRFWGVGELPPNESTPLNISFPPPPHTHTRAHTHAHTHETRIFDEILIYVDIHVYLLRLNDVCGLLPGQSPEANTIDSD